MPSVRHHRPWDITRSALLKSCRARGLYRRSGISPCPEDSRVGIINQKSLLVKPFKSNYNIIMQHIADQIHKTLIKRKRTVSVAESCTGGLVCAALTSISGSSGYFSLGIITYSNQAKHGLLGIPLTLINNKGAVSAEVALKMAEAVRKLAKTDYGISITGIAGPTGGSPWKPVGTVFIAVCDKKRLICRGFRLKGSRASIRKQSVTMALRLFKNFLG